MEYRFPSWLAYSVMGLLTLTLGVGGYWVQLPTTSSHPRHSVVVCMFAIFSLFLLWAYLYVKRYSIQIMGEAVILTGAFRTRTISLSEIKQVVTMTAPRSGTDSWLVDEHDQVIAKLMAASKDMARCSSAWGRRFSRGRCFSIGLPVGGLGKCRWRAIRIGYLTRLPPLRVEEGLVGCC